MISTDVVRTAQQTHFVSVKHTNILSGQNVECQNDKFGGRQRNDWTLQGGGVQLLSSHVTELEALRKLLMHAAKLQYVIF
jgi:hypothetical protein